MVMFICLGFLVLNSIENKIWLLEVHVQGRFKYVIVDICFTYNVLGYKKYG
jgi:hypothetical protein